MAAVVILKSTDICPIFRILASSTFSFFFILICVLPGVLESVRLKNSKNKKESRHSKTIELLV